MAFYRKYDLPIELESESVSSVRHSKKWQGTRTSTVPVSREVRYRVVILGAAGVGKSTIISQFLYGCLPDNIEHLSLEGVSPESLFVPSAGPCSPSAIDMHEAHYDVDDRRLIFELVEMRVEVAGGDNWWADIPSGDAYVIVYSVNDDASLDAVSRIRDELVEQHSYLHVPIVIVANKMDKNDGSRHVQTVTTEMMAVLDWDHGYAATSAATDRDSLTAIFLQIFRQVEFPPDHEMKVWLDLHSLSSRQRTRGNTLKSRLSRRIKKLMCGPL